MATRDELFRQFGPKLTETLFDYLLELVNELRQEQGNPQITKQEYINLLSNHITQIPDYDWMSETP